MLAEARPGITLGLSDAETRIPSASLGRASSRRRIPMRTATRTPRSWLSRAVLGAALVGGAAANNGTTLHGSGKDRLGYCDLESCPPDSAPAQSHGTFLYGEPGDDRRAQPEQGGGPGARRPAPLIQPSPSGRGQRRVPQRGACGRAGGRRAVRPVLRLGPTVEPNRTPGEGRGVPRPSPCRSPRGEHRTTANRQRRCTAAGQARAKFRPGLAAKVTEAGRGAPSTRIPMLNQRCGPGSPAIAPLFTERRIR